MHGIRVVATTALLALGLGAPVAGQSVEAGFRLGWTRSGFETERAEEPDHLNSVVAGASLTIPVTRNLAIQPEALLLVKGAARPGLGMGVAGGDTIFYHWTDRASLTYAELPVLARLSLPAAGRVRPYLAAGPYLAWRAACSTYLIPLTYAATATAAEPTASLGSACLAGTVRRVDVGATAAAGARLPLGHRLAAVADARYDLGARSVLAPAAPGLRNHTLAVSLGLSFPLASSAGPTGR